MMRTPNLMKIGQLT